MSFEGVHVAVITPFSKDGSLDQGALKSHLEFLVSEGVRGLVACGTTGEGPTLGREERVQVMQACLQAARGTSVCVLAGCGSNDTKTARALIQEAEDLGCDGTLVVTPYYNKPTASGVLAHYLYLADHATKPILLYNVPGRTNVPITLDTVSKLFEHPRIAGIKEASGQYSYWLSLAEVAERLGKTLLAGDDDAFATIQAFGGKGIISACANVLPGAFVRLHRLMIEGDWPAAFRLQLRLAPVVRSLFAETNPAPIKYALASRGVQNTLRLPLVPVSAATESLIRREAERFVVGEPL